VHFPPRVEGVQPEFGVAGSSPAIQHVLRIIRKLSSSVAPVLITGESGVGKELVARAVHAVSPLARQGFVPVDAATLVGTLMESELFGYVRGAFTGAVADKAGLVRFAHGGTLFLDEVGELPLDAQAKLLRLLQEGEVRPVGSARPVRVDVRILAATNRDLSREVQAGRFREDLYYRLKVVVIRVPPLRERREDILLLARFFIAKYAVQPVQLSEPVIKRLLAHDWPGNVRELENAMRAAVALTSSPVLRLQDLPSNVRPGPALDQEEGSSTIEPLWEVERRHILRAIEHTKGDVVTAARFLGIGKTTLYRKLREYRGKGAKEQGRPAAARAGAA
jgi:two-component system response regulator HydG